PKLSFFVGAEYIGDIELHVAGRPENLEAAVRRTLNNINPNLTILDMLSLQEQLDLNFNQDKLVARLTELFGLLALILACVGLYGVTSYSVARRTNEIGIRMALGANRGNVVWLVLREALIQLVIGLAIGIPVVLAGGKLMASQLYGVKSHNPVILVVAIVVLAACSVAAALVPSRRAASIDPMQALRME
ncbi:MAG TPA: FtsX-like permease family protein, partial [Terriglobia bacterium]|nr:FtsX-like permease family protein [Terriglobia bacterium]